MSATILLILTYWANGHREILLKDFPTKAACERGVAEIYRVTGIHRHVNAEPHYECVENRP